jgi:hypothetical protein
MLFAMGDLQCEFNKLLSVLKANHCLDKTEKLAADVRLITVGDYFDYHDKESNDVQRTQRNGCQILEWLSKHSSEQVTILLGNHDICRVAELINYSEERYAKARQLAIEVSLEECPKKRQRFREQFPELPSPGIAERDFSSYGVKQRELIIQLLLEERVQLACVASFNGHPVLLNHAGVTERELEILQLSGETNPEIIAEALNTTLRKAVQKVSKAWQRGERPALDLSPLHVAGTTDQEGGGLLYHRPCNPEAYKSSWAFDSHRPRRYHPQALPRGLIQVCGHTTHKKCLKELGDWIHPSARSQVLWQLRTLTVDNDQVSYRAGTPKDFNDTEAIMIMIDAAINDVSPKQYPLLKLTEQSPLC